MENKTAHTQNKMTPNITHTHNFILTEGFRKKLTSFHISRSVRTAEGLHSIPSAIILLTNQFNEPSLTSLVFLSGQGVYFIPPATNHSQQTKPPQLTNEDVGQGVGSNVSEVYEQGSSAKDKTADKNGSQTKVKTPENVIGFNVGKVRNFLNEDKVLKHKTVNKASKGKLITLEAIIFADAEKTPTERVTPFSNSRCVLVKRHSQIFSKKTSFFQTFSPVCICEGKLK